MLDVSLPELAQQLRSAPAWQRKQELDVLSRDLLAHVPLVNGERVPLGDDTAAIKDGDGYLLLAAEVIYPPLVAANPYLAGRSAVLANVNDVYAMGGKPLAIVNTILAPNTDIAARIMSGLKDGCQRYGVALLGGHLTANSEVTSVAACILGRAQTLLSSFEAQPGDLILHVTNLRGAFHPNFPFWDCSAHLSDAELQRDLAILPAMAETGWCKAARDISMAGMLGSTMMMLELSNVGATIDLEAVPVPEAAKARYLDWLVGFPSYGFILAVSPQYLATVQGAFAEHGISCATIGKVIAEPQMILSRETETVMLWDFEKTPFIGFTSSKQTKSLT
ncbi:MAG: sll0787 family AIR synthase-like protein [Chloroflexi bacterium]|nr:sll0787 family AIR synthase-like protein [Chloroflexota bacterium]